MATQSRALWAAAALFLALPAAARPPNVVLLFSDEHRYQAMGHTETPAVQTPNMDRLAREGVSFTHALSNYPVCSPYRAMQLTGQWPHRTGVLRNGQALRRGQRTMAHAFADAGYVTGYIGKWHLGYYGALPGLGFERYIPWTGDNRHWDSSFHPQGGKARHSAEYNARVMTDQALAFIERHRDQPFFLVVSWNPPHLVHTDAPEEKQALYRDPARLPLRPNQVLRPQPRRRAALRGYHAHVSAIDDEIGRVVAGLESLELSADTILVYTSDHGSMLGSHGVWDKRQPYDEAIRVPFLLSWPGHARTREVGALFGVLDVFPTLVALAGLPPPTGVDGRDFSPWVHGRQGPDPESAFLMNIEQTPAEFQTKKLFRGIRTRTHTYAVTEEGPWLLFDNRVDPYQRTNLVDDPAHAALRSALDGMVRAWLARAGDPFVPGPRP